MLEIRRLSLRHPAPLHDISLACAAGELTVILGPNGAGKSTLLHAIGGYYPAAAGEILLAGEALADLDAGRLASCRALVEQHPARPAGMRVADLLCIGVAQPDPAILVQVLALSDCQTLLARDCASLSGGELQRVHLARALHQLLSSKAPQRYLLLDEPTAALDIGAANQQLATLRQLAQRWQLGMIAVLHDVNLALRHADKVLLLKEGVQIAHGDTAQVMTQARLEQVYDTRLAELSDHHGQRAFIAC